MKLSNGAVVTPVTGEEAEDLLKNFPGYVDGLVRAGPSRCLLPTAYNRFAEEYINFKFRSSDVVIVTYAKCGTTWMQEILWTMCHNPDLDNPDADLDLSIRSPFLEFDCMVDVLTKKNGHNSTLVKALQKRDPAASPDAGVFLGLTKVAEDPRIIKTHLPFSILPLNLLDTCKVVYVARNPKDALSSYLHHHRLIKIHDYQGTDDQFVDYFINGQLLHGGYADHLAEAWPLRGHKNLAFLFYEDLKRDPDAQLKNLDAFLGTGLTDQQLDNVKNRTGFSNMKARMGACVAVDGDAVEGMGVTALFNAKAAQEGGFYRKGKAGSWKEDISEKNLAKIDRYIAEQITAKMPDLKFSYE
ncbi:sulfotransferase 1A1-like isoform X1 [Hyalella azteca]|uniref:Sulfotransferase 1A1-like isoform X1 n=1 Tax=Hyalella azteca TaxID=294128 RepID=A0A8B7NGR2_HYAAZ|nr:sulfotransferase 1A1-like isoform X1 [Hyalella azteca]